uniref:Uncharacterized protein n=1 Tax=Arundo donax TaxID=35708 RepID=A0A0A9BDA4_ARUDO
MPGTWFALDYDPVLVSYVHFLLAYRCIVSITQNTESI